MDRGSPQGTEGSVSDCMYMFVMFALSSCGGHRQCDLLHQILTINMNGTRSKGHAAEYSAEGLNLDHQPPTYHGM